METYILNMPQRQDRKSSVSHEFEEKAEFSYHFVTPISHQIPRVSHWLSFQDITKKAKGTNLDYFIFCEDDHVFTDAYNETYLLSMIREADTLGADILLGGASAMKSPIQISEHLFWLNIFNGTQFVIVFKRMYEAIINSKYDEETVVTDFFLSLLSDNIFVIYPFISVQKEFGYSDVTLSNNKSGHVEELFQGTTNGLNILNKVRRYYDRLL